MTAGTSNRRGRKAGTGGVALLLLVGMSGIGAARVPDQRSLCVPLLAPCSSSSALPNSTGGSHGGAVGGGFGGLTDHEPAPGNPAAPAPHPLTDPAAPVFTQPSAQLGGDSISFSGLRAVSVVTVRLADGTSIPVLKLQADDVVITGFVLDVRRATGPSLVSTSTRMELAGNVSVYVNSLTATLLDGTGISLLAPTPPPGNELPSQLLRVNLGLVGVVADSISFADSHQRIHD